MSQRDWNLATLAELACGFCTPGNVANLDVLPFGTGHINDTFLVRGGSQVEPFIFQRLNHEVFRRPEDVMANTGLVSRHLETKYLPLTLLRPIPYQDGQLFCRDDAGNYWRAFNYIEDTYTVERAESVGQASAAATAMGMFLSGLSDLDPSLVFPSIPHFHDSVLRLEHFNAAVEDNLAGRLEEVQAEVGFLRREQGMFFHIANLGLPQRVVHNDTKISNVLFSEITHEVVAVIDWDTIMPGAIPSDFGDMVRTMATTLSEDDPRIGEVAVRLDFFKALAEGFLLPLQNVLQPVEIDSLVDGAKWIILEQMMRFLGDYLNGDIYYKTRYPDHNLVRARNQLALYQSILDNETNMRRLVKEVQNQ